MSRAAARRDETETLLASLGVSPDDLVGLADIARDLGVTVRTVQKYVERGDFPEPLGRTSAGRVWLRTDVRSWAAKTLPLTPGRPRKAEDR